MIIEEPLSIRKHYYHPYLSIDYLKKLSHQDIRDIYKSETKNVNDEYANGSEPIAETTPDSEQTNLVSSLCKDGMHRPALDIDVPCELIPSSTPGHSHLYFPTVALDWEQYVRLMAVLVECGILEANYMAASVRRGATCLRLPWVPKISLQDALDASSKYANEKNADSNIAKALAESIEISDYAKVSNEKPSYKLYSKLGY